ncbi:unnamed protein product [Musa textilis]
MPRSTFSSFITAPEIYATVDMGNPFLNRTVDGFLKIGTVTNCVAASRVAVEEAYQCVRKGSISKRKFEDALKRMCKEGVYWGTVTGVYVGVEHNIERISGTRNWKNAMLGGAITGLLISAASNNGKDKIIKDTITAGAVATAIEFINHLT